jgi:AcrR family transcriptional regulator
MAEPVRAPRQYVSPLRREKAAQTRERIVAAGCDLLQRSSIRDWGGLTIRAVAERAGVNERTVYRCFVNERGLRDAVMHRLEEQAGIDLEGMGLEDISEVTARILRHISAYPREARPVLDPTLKDASRRQREALHKALAQWTGDWTESEKEAAAAMFDVLWSVASYERLVVDWQMEDGDAIRAITWSVGLIEETVRQGRRPSDSTVTPSRTRRPRSSVGPCSGAEAV